ncbi:hypothetical protein T4B_706 [Trichinella pseudospiralis]|uniref:Uncharacterized protein n=2 Tax=Trichinella pseudospiralis TaxID=6337 RepID=A0A0V1FXT8_TRIPS|nr:hypothetical protein T4A_2045 [Trichinella pseudospiralis]KRY90677.1 hypothetical protein T4D_8906 [Trichinella pseudospiralis]KRZ28342.1 hypothetical protein T4B_706 [Trichinella pseudospiralis]KRZ38864.1 hypothetical protein T4C_12080 [Trichinella pseudospiralis]
MAPAITVEAAMAMAGAAAYTAAAAAAAEEAADNSSSSLAASFSLPMIAYLKAQVCLHKMQPPRQGMLDKSSYKARVSGATWRRLGHEMVLTCTAQA